MLTSLNQKLNLFTGSIQKNIKKGVTAMLLLFTFTNILNDYFFKANNTYSTSFLKSTLPFFTVKIAPE